MQKTKKNNDYMLLKKLFGFDPSKTTIRTELLAGLTTFLTMSYILAVNPAMFSQLDGMPAGASDYRL